MTTTALDETSSAADLLQAFECGSLDPAQFDHRLHLRMAWLYLQREGFPDGASAFRRHLKAYVEKVGAQGKYHETITWAYLALLNEEMSLRSTPGESFDSMIARRPDLLDHSDGAIARCYSKAQLELPAARQVFLLPVAGSVSP